MNKLKYVWQWLVCEYQVHRAIHPPTYPDMMKRVNTFWLRDSDKYQSLSNQIVAIQALSKGDRTLWDALSDSDKILPDGKGDLITKGLLDIKDKS